jgi:hypothetical protein
MIGWLMTLIQNGQLQGCNRYHLIIATAKSYKEKKATKKWIQLQVIAKLSPM